jgi:protein SMG6
MARPQVSAHGRPSPTPKCSGDYVSASSTSSYTASISSSAFTLSSTTDGSSTSSALFDGRPNQDQAGTNVFSDQLKKLYRQISNLEAKVKQEDSVDDADDLMSSRVVLKGKEVENDDLEKEKWKKQITDHKTLVPSLSGIFHI